MSARDPQHRATPVQRLTLPERRFVVAVVALSALLVISLVHRLWATVAG